MTRYAIKTPRGWLSGVWMYPEGPTRSYDSDSRLALTDATRTEAVLTAERCGLTDYTIEAVER